MAPKITNADRDKLNEILVMNGYYFGLHKITKDYDLTSEQFRKIKSGLAQHILGKIREGKQEIARLQAVVVRLEAACQAAAIVNPAEGMQAITPTINRLMQEMKAFDGWTISLLETDISLLATVQNPETAGIRVKSLRESFANLWALRANGWKPFGKYPEQFDMTYFYP